jgi:hypothetical protein
MMSTGLRIVGLNIINRGGLLALLDVEPDLMILRKLAVIAGPYGVFVGLPRTARIGRDGRQERDAAGKPIFDTLVEWKTKEISTRFQDVIRDLIAADYPNLLAGEAVRPPLIDRGFGEFDGGDTQSPPPPSRSRRSSKARLAARPSTDLHDDPVGDIYPDGRGT